MFVCGMCVVLEVNNRFGASVASFCSSVRVLPSFDLTVDLQAKMNLDVRHGPASDLYAVVARTLYRGV